MLSLIVAMDQNQLIGQGNELPWHIPADLKHFKTMTLGKPVIMGRKTFESIESRLGKPLPGRENIVLTRNESFHYDGVKSFQTLDDAIDACASEPEVVVIGGAEIFKLAFPKAKRFYLTRIDHAFDGDIHFPQWDESEWALISEKAAVADNENAYACRYQVLERKGS